MKHEVGSHVQNDHLYDTALLLESTAESEDGASIGISDGAIEGGCKRLFELKRVVAETSIAMT